MKGKNQTSQTKKPSSWSKFKNSAFVCKIKNSKFGQFVLKVVKKIKKPSVGFYLSLASLVFAIVACVLYFLTYDALHFTDRWVTALTFIGLWSLVFLTVSALVTGNKPFYVDIFYVIAAFTLTVAALKFLVPCLSPIGIYYTVTMGDMESYAVGVPRCIACCVFFVVSVVCLIVSAFFRISKKEEGDA